MKNNYQILVREKYQFQVEKVETVGKNCISYSTYIRKDGYFNTVKKFSISRKVSQKNHDLRAQYLNTVKVTAVSMFLAQLECIIYCELHVREFKKAGVFKTQSQLNTLISAFFRMK